MALRTIRVQGDPVLEKICKPVKELTPRTKELIEDMLDTMYEANGVGLAAPQVGILKRIVVIDVGEGPGRDGESGYFGDVRGADRRRGMFEYSREKPDRSQDQIM